MIFGDNLDHTRRSLENTIVFLKGQIPRYIASVESHNEIYSYPLVGNVSERVKLSDLDLCSPPKLGFVNSHGRVVLGKRRASRQYRAGLSTNNTYFDDVFHHNERVSLRSTPVEQALVNNYPPVEEAVDVLSKLHSRSIAISPYYALTLGDTGVIKVYREGEGVGVMVDHKPKLTNRFSFLQEEIEEVFNENY